MMPLPTMRSLVYLFICMQYKVDEMKKRAIHTAGISFKNSAIFVCFAILRGNYHLHVNCRHLRAISPDGFSLRSGVCLASWNCMRSKSPTFSILESNACDFRSGRPQCRARRWQTSGNRSAKYVILNFTFKC